MATAGAKSVELVRVGAVILKNAKSSFPEYTSVAVLSQDRLMVINKNECTLQLHSCCDGKLLAIYKLLAQPHDVCVVDTRQIQVAVTLMNAKIEILSVESTEEYAAINWVRTLDVVEKFKYCHGVKAFKSAEKLLVSGGNVKKDSKGYWICWGLVDKDVKILEICQSGEPGYGSDSYLATSADDSMVYVSCFAGLRYEDNNGVYAFDVMDGSLKFTYHHIDLKNPKGISADGEGFIYVCNMSPPCIHQLTERMEAVAIHRVGMQTVELVAIYWEKQHEELYVTIMRSGEVWRLHPHWSDQQVTLSKMSNQESNSTSGERCLLLGQPKMPSSEDVVKLWAKENCINASAVDELLKEGFTSIEALKLLESDDLANTKIPSGQRKLILVSVNRLFEKDVTQVQSVQSEHTDIFSKGDSQHGRQSRTTQQASTTNSVYATRHQPLTALSVGTEDPYTHVMATTVHPYQELPPDCAIIGPTSSLSRQELKHIRHLQSSLDSRIETPSWKDLRNNLQSGAADFTSSFARADVPSVDDTDRFMHIACLLINVGSRVLRRLLIYHTVTATCTLDQYLAKNRIAINMQRKRKILNKSQMDILFPPGGSTNLSDYDITLLSALFTNIVPTISQQQLNMMQFLRDKRNEIFGHASSVTVNSSDYQTFWNDICRTLEALSKQCGDPDFENEIAREIQDIQVSTVQGTSFLDKLQTRSRRMDTLERLVQDLISSRAQESDETSDDSDS